MRYLPLAGLALMISAGCQPVSTSLTEGQKAAIASEVRAIHEAFYDAWEAKPDDVETGMSYYIDSEDFAFAREGDLIRGFAAFDDFVSSFMAEVADTDWTRTDVLVTVLAEDVVHVFEKGAVVVTDTEGVVGAETPFTYTHVWVRRNGEWKIQFAHAAYVF